MRIVTDKAPKAIGPYSQGQAYQNLVFTSGQIPLDPDTGKLVEGIEEQTRRCILNLSEVLQAGGSSLQNVIKTTVFLKDMNDFAAMNAVYAREFGDNLPARSAVQVAKLPLDAMVEIEAIAYR